MERQQQIIEWFKLTYPNATLMKSVEITGINKSRLHRIFHQAPMKLFEWELFRHAIARKQNNLIDNKLEDAFEQCLICLGKRGKQQLLVRLQRLCQLTKIICTHPKPRSRK